MVKAKFKVEGIDEIRKGMKKLGKIPQKHITSSARKGMNIVLKDAKTHAPEDQGHLKQGMKLKGERSRKKGKKAYQVIFDPRYNHIFAKQNKDGKITAYYPISQEYGFFTVNGRYIPGFMFVHNALSNNTKQMERTIVTDLKSKIDAEIAKGGG